jgi:hypothetical protein
VNKTKPIPSAVYRLQALQAPVLAITKKLCIGTNLRIHDTLLTLMSGRLLETRGALIPALSSMGLNQNECLRTRAAIQQGRWTVRNLLKHFHTWVAKHTDWQPLQVAGFNIKAIDTTCIYRPRLQNCTTTHFNSTAGKSLPATCFSMLSAMGRVGQQKAGLLLHLTRGDDHARTEERLMEQACKKAKEFVLKTDILTADRKFPVMVMLEGGIQNVVIRRATNFTVTRALTEKDKNEKSIGRPRKQGAVIRPLERSHKKKVHPASEPDEVQTWTDEHGNKLEAKIWRNVVLTVQRTWSEERKALNMAQNWIVMVITHPKYPVPMVVLMNVELTGEEASRVTRGRWGVEQMPLVSKQLLGGHRMYVSEEEMCFRLPELTFLAANILTVVAAGCEAMPTGWWDVKARPTAGRFRRSLDAIRDLRVITVPKRLRKKESVTAQLPKGYHRGIQNKNGDAGLHPTPLTQGIDSRGQQSSIDHNP